MPQCIIHLITDFYINSRRYAEPDTFDSLFTALSWQQQHPTRFLPRTIGEEEDEEEGLSTAEVVKAGAKRHFFTWFSCHIRQPTPVLNFI